MKWVIDEVEVYRLNKWESKLEICHEWIHVRWKRMVIHFMLWTIIFNFKVKG